MMITEYKSRCAVVALLAGAGLALGGAQATAADLGGDCCADLEERIAELEATTARKGNRKVKLEVSGQVNEAIIFWDDGVEDNAGVYTNDASRSRFRFKGDAKISSDFKAGYLLEIGVRANNSKRFDQDNPSPADQAGLDLRHSTWYLDSKTFGRVWVGLTGGASESVTEINVAGTSDVAKFADIEDLAGGLGLRRADNGLFMVGGANVAATEVTMRRLIRDGGNQPGEGRRHNLVRYDTPEFMGFKGTVNWGSDDAWEIGLRYKGEFAGFKMAAGIAYGDSSEPPQGTFGFDCTANRTLNANVGGTGKDGDCEQLGGSISVMHVQSGLYANFAAGYMEDNLTAARGGELGLANLEDRHEFWAIEAGIQQKWMPIGKTTIFGQYYDNDGGFVDRNYGNGVGRILDSEIQSWSIGMMQGVDAAAMNLYVIYRNVETEATFSGAGTVEFQDIDLFMAGGIIKF